MCRMYTVLGDGEQGTIAPVEQLPNLEGRTILGGRAGLR